MNFIRSFFEYPVGIIAVLLLFSSSLNAQNTCSQSLIKAQFTYYEGRVEEIPLMLEACLKDGFTTDEKLQAYRLLTLTYLYMNEPANAEKVMLDFLQLNPTYTINEAVDPAEFINLYNQFRTWPVYLTGIKAGINSTYVNILQAYSTDNTYTSHAVYTPAFSYQTGIILEIPLKKRFSGIAELYLSGKKFTYNNEFFKYSKLQETESQNRIDIPLLLNYNFPGKKIIPYLSGGITNSLLMKSQMEVRRIDVDSINAVQIETKGPNITLSSKRRLFTFSGTINLGFKYTRDRNIFIVEGRYSMGLNNMVKKGKRYAEQSEQIFTYGYIDNDFTLRSFSISVGYLIPVYKPRRLNSKKHTDINSTFQ